MFEVEWQKCKDGQWCNFWNLDLSDPAFYGLEGIYLIFDANHRYVYAGRGIIRDRILVHQSDFDFHDYPEKLFITWAKADYYTQITAVRYLQLKLRPVLNKVLPLPTEGQIVVNLPI
jgi:hypothetical protein